MIEFLFYAQILGAATGSVQSRHSHVYVYGGAVIDLERGQERFLQRHETDWCSDEVSNCISGQTFSIAVPRYCGSWRTGDTFSSRDVRTQVLNRYAPGEYSKYQTGHYSHDLWLMGSDDRPWIVYVYGDVGVVGIFLNYDQSRDLVNVARTGGVGQLEEMSEGAAGVGFLRLVTFEGAVNCSERP
jgi:hypothetical protein